MAWRPAAAQFFAVAQPDGGDGVAIVLPGARGRAAGAIGGQQQQEWRDAHEAYILQQAFEEGCCRSKRRVAGRTQV